MSSARRCGAFVWRCPQCHNAVAKAIVRKGLHCPRRGCEDAPKPVESTCRTTLRAGAVRCGRHGGGSPQAEAKEEQRQAVAEAVADLARLGVPVETTPLDALEVMLHEAMGNVAALRLLVSGLDDRPVFTIEDGEVRGNDSIYGPDHNGDGKPHVLVVMYSDERDRLARIAKDCVGLGLDERRVKVAEAHTTRLFDAVGRALSAIPDKHRDAFKVALAKEIRAA